jgi:hypothetical protein
MNRPFIFRLSLFSIAVLLVTSSFAQTKTKRYTINWLPVLELTQDDLPSVSLNFEGISFDGNKQPRYVITEPLFTPAEVKVTLKNVVTEVLSNTKGVTDIQSLGEEFKIETHLVTRKKVNYYSASVLPIRRRGGTIEKLISFETEITTSPSVSRSASVSRSYARNSVLKNGEWYKIGVVQNGIHKLDYNFLKNLGIDVAAINPKRIQIYGNGGGSLPYANSIARYDDLQENAIYVEGENDGRLDSSDYVLFYGTSQTRWNYNETTAQFNHVLNMYADTTYYFITVEQNAGRRIQSRASASSPTATVTSFDDYYFKEVEINNLIGSGREWYGESMDVINNTVSFTVNVSNISTSDSVHLRSTYAGRAKNSGFNNSFTLRMNGGLIGTIAFSDVGDYPADNYANPVSYASAFPATTGTMNFGITLNSTDASAQGWINYVELNYRRNLIMSGNQFQFRDSKNTGAGVVAEYQINNSSPAVQVWDVTNPINPVLQQSQYNAGTISFAANADQMHEYLAWTGQQYNNAFNCGTVVNQNLHGLPQANMLIVTNPGFLQQANSLADFHRSYDNMTVHVVTTTEIYNEYSSGAQDVCAIRDFTKMFYDRATGPITMPEYLLLFGDASYDPKNRLPSNTNYVICYQAANGYNKTQSYISDDFFALLDDYEGEWSYGELMDICVGRMPVRSAIEATSMVNKIFHYVNGNGVTPNPTLNNWRNVITFVADDQDNNTHVKQADSLAVRVARSYPIYNIEKIYLDAFNQVTGAGGQRYPDAHDAISNRIDRGTLLITYIGHGNEINWTKERVLEISDINAWANIDRLAAFLTATCEFTRVDDPSRTSAGELVYLNPTGGGICMFTTTRLAYSNSNYNLCQRFIIHFFEKQNGSPLTCGQIFEQTKLDVYTDSNLRNFILLGDPALRLAFPKFNVKTNTVNGVDASLPTDTLKALSKVTITGEIQDGNGNKLTSFNGLVMPTVFDKVQRFATIGNDINDRTDPSSPMSFELQKNIIYSGRTSVTNGEFSFTFIVPKDISFQVGTGKISYYAHNGTDDANGYNNTVYVGGINTNAAQDIEGPMVKLYMNDEKFVRGGITDKSPFLYAVLNDSSGINMVGTGIGHDITAELDAKTDKQYVLNEYYESDLNTYQSGKVRYQFKNLTSGPHLLTLKVWDVYNNSSESNTEFIVSETAELALDHVLNYPNPFTTHTTFMFDHNRPYTSMNVQVQIFTVSGKLVKTLSDRITSTGNHFDNMHWDGLDDYGDKIGRGVYVYKLRVQTDDGDYADQFEKLVILR